MGRLALGSEERFGTGVSRKVRHDYSLHDGSDFCATAIGGWRRLALPRSDFNHGWRRRRVVLFYPGRIDRILCDHCDRYVHVRFQVSREGKL